MAPKRAAMAERLQPGPGAIGGLDAFSAQPEPPPLVNDSDPTSLPITALVESDDNLRIELADITEMAESISAVGIINPLLVARTGVAGRWQVIAGHRRLAAARIAGLDTVPVTTRELTDAQRTEIMLIENLHRADLSPIEEARGYERLRKITKGGQRALAERVGKSQSHISKRLALLRLPDDMLAEVDSGGITVADAAELAQLADEPEALRAATAEAKQSWISAAQAVATQKRNLAHNADIDKQLAALRAAGVECITDDIKSWSAKTGPCPLKWLWGQEYEDLGDHEKADCRAVWVSTDYRGRRELMELCTNPAGHRLAGPGTTTHLDDAAQARQALIEDRRKEHQASHIDFCRKLAGGDPGRAAGWIAQIWVTNQRERPGIEAGTIARILDADLGEDETAFCDEHHIASLLGAKASTVHAQRVLYALALGAGVDSALNGGDWTDPDTFQPDVFWGTDVIELYYRHILEAGYEPDDADRAILEYLQPSEDEDGPSDDE